MSSITTLFIQHKELEDYEKDATQLKNDFPKMASLLTTAVDTLLYEVTLQMAPVERDLPKLVCNNLGSAIATSRLSAITKLVDSDKDLLSFYIRECIRHSLHIDTNACRDTQLLPSILALLINHLAFERRISVSVASAHTLLKLEADVVHCCALALLPLANFTQLTESEMESAQKGTKLSEKNLYSWIGDILWDRLLLLLSDDFKPLTEWANTYSQLHKLLISRCTSPTERRRVSVMNTVSIFAACFPEHVAENIDRHAPGISSFVKAYEKGNKPLALRQQAAFLESYFEQIYDESLFNLFEYGGSAAFNEEERLSYVEDVVQHYLTDTDLAQRTEEDIEFVISIIKEDNASYKCPYSMKKFFLQQLQIDKSSRAMAVLEKLIAKIKPTLPLDKISYAPKYLEDNRGVTDSCMQQDLFDILFELQHEHDMKCPASADLFSAFMRYSEYLRDVHNAAIGKVCPSKRHRHRHGKKKRSNTQPAERVPVLLSAVRLTSLRLAVLENVAKTMANQPTPYKNGQADAIKSIASTLEQNHELQVYVLAKVLAIVGSQQIFTHLLLNRHDWDMFGKWVRVYRLKQTVVPYGHADFSFMLSDGYDIRFFEFKEAFQRMKKDKKPTALVNYCTNLSQYDEKIVLDLRMFLVLVAYYEYLEKNQHCEFADTLLEQLTKPLALEEHEKKMIRWILDYSKLIRFDSQGDKLCTVFDAPTENIHLHDNSFQVALINLLATAMGLPKNSNHIYTYLFNSNALPATYGVGMVSRSTLYNNYDCNSKMSYAGINESSLRMFSQNGVYTAYLACWGALLLNLLTFPTNADTLVSRVFSGEATYGESWEQGKITDRNILLRNFLSVRASCNWSWLSANLGITGEGRERLWVMFLEKYREFALSGNYTCFKGVYTVSNDIDEYERMWDKDIFQPIATNKRKLEESANQSICSSLASFMRRLPSVQCQYLNTLETSLVASNINNLRVNPKAEELKTMRLFLARREVFPHLPLIGYCVEFYNWLYDTYSGSLDASMLQQPVCSLWMQYKDKQKAKHIHSLFDKIVTSWGNFLAFAGGISSGECQASDTFAHKIDANTPIAFFVTTSGSDTPNVFLRLIEVLCAHQNRFIRATSTASSDDDVTEEENAHTALELDVCYVKSNGFMDLLVNGGEMFDEIYQAHYLETDQDGVAHFDWVRMQKLVKRLYLQYKPILISRNLHNRKFVCKPGATSATNNNILDHLNNLPLQVKVPIDPEVITSFTNDIQNKYARVNAQEKAEYLLVLQKSLLTYEAQLTASKYEKYSIKQFLVDAGEDEAEEPICYIPKEICGQNYGPFLHLLHNLTTDLSNPN